MINDDKSLIVAKMLKIAHHCNLLQPALALPIAAGTLLAGGLGCSPLSGCRKKLN